MAFNGNPQRHISTLLFVLSSSFTTLLAVNNLDIPANLMPDFYLWAGGILALLIILTALFTAPWKKIRDNEAQHIYFGAIVMLSLLWVLRGGIQEGLSFHLLGMTLLCLMFEWQFAIMAASAIVLIATVRGSAGWEAYGLNLLLMGILPVLFSRLSLYFSQRWLPHNYFIYVLVNAFLVGGLSILLAGGASASIQHLADVHLQGTIVQNFAQILPLLVFGEGFINGGVISLVVAYRPHWIATFHDGWYLQGK